jgi:hypothetical protein
MSYDRDDYWQEAFEIAMDDAGCGELLAQITKEQREFIGAALAGSRECESLAFHVPENPMIERNARLERALKWERELEHCRDCNGTGRIEYRAGPWWCNSGCDTCHGDGKVHPRREARPSS